MKKKKNIDVVVLIVIGVIILITTIVLMKPPKPTSPSIVGADTNTDPSQAENIVELKNYKFEPDKLKAEAGKDLWIRIDGKEGTHNFVVSELEFSSAILGEGDSEYFNIKIPKDAKGKTYQFVSDVGNDQAEGMVGEIVVK